jgi:small-conductance mechanosensitive channel
MDMSFLDWLQEWNVNRLLLAALIFFVILAIGMVFRRLAWSRLSRFASTTQTKWDDQLLLHLSAPATALIFVAALAGAAQAMVPEVRSHPLVVFGVKVAAILVTVWIIERAVTVFFHFAMVLQNLSSSTRTLFLTITRTVILSIALLIVLDTLGVSITPLLASLGVGSVAVALALQDTLSNFFGGLYILVDKPIRIGDLIQIEDVEGTVSAIGWRSTRLLLPSNQLVIVPNSKVAGSRLKNFDLPDPESSIVVELLVPFGEDLDRISEITEEVARDVVKRVPNTILSFQPMVRFTAVTDMGIKFIVIMRTKTWGDGFFLKHEFIRSISARYRLEKIPMAVPQRLLHWSESGERQAKVEPETYRPQPTHSPGPSGHA